jgi:hypothetical protein
MMFRSEEFDLPLPPPPPTEWAPAWAPEAGTRPKQHDWPGIVGALVAIALLVLLGMFMNGGCGRQGAAPVPISAPAAPAPAVVSAPEPASAPSFSPPAAPAPHRFAWHRVRSYEGAAMKDTESFDIRGDEWCIRWRTWTADGESGNFAVIVRTGEGDMKALVGNIIGAGADTSTMRGAGRYYLQIQTGQPYSVQVEEWR